MIGRGPRILVLSGDRHPEKRAEQGRIVRNGVRQGRLEWLPEPRGTGTVLEKWGEWPRHGGNGHLPGKPTDSETSTSRQ
jgi:hypothetical protein